MLFGKQRVGKPRSAAWTMRSRPTLQLGPVAGLLEPAKKSENAGKMAVPDEAPDAPDETRPIRWLHRLHILSFWASWCAACRSVAWQAPQISWRRTYTPYLLTCTIVAKYLIVSSRHAQSPSRSFLLWSHLTCHDQHSNLDAPLTLLIMSSGADIILILGE